MVEARARQLTIARFAWTDSAGHPVAALGPQIRSEAPQWFVDRLHLPTLEDSQPVIVGGEKYGTVSLRLNPALSYTLLWLGCWGQSGILRRGTGLSLAVTRVILRSGVQPLRDLAASARRFGQGDYAVRISAEGPPETAQCIQAFNSMAENIESLLASLRLSEEKNRLLALQVEQSSDAIFSHDQGGIVTSWNRGAARLYGYSAAEAIGRPLRALDLWDGRGASADPGGAAGSGALPASFETCAKTKTGHLDEVAVVRTPDHATSLELAYEIRPGVPDDLVGDIGRIGQIVVNLVGNAIKFTERGEVAVRVDAEAVTADTVTLRVSVQDTGIGIAAEKSRLIFDAFAQADASTTRRFGGTGLGLAICRRLVERMGGRIWLDRELGRGSPFHFTL